MILYGIPTCDTCRKARKALEGAGHEVTFRDVRQVPLTEDEWAPLLVMFGEKLVNRSSATWRGLDDDQRARSFADLLAENPTLMKRPIVVADGQMTLGWDDKARAAWGL